MCDILYLFAFYFYLKWFKITQGSHSSSKRLHNQKKAKEVINFDDRGVSLKYIDELVSVVL